MSTGMNRAVRSAGTGFSASLVEDVIGETGDFLESKHGTWFRRALPLILRFGFNQPVLGSVFGIVNIYYGMGKTLVQTHRAVRKAAKYWGFVHGAHWAAGQLRPNLKCARLRLLPGKAFIDIRKTIKYSNQRKGGIEVSNQTWNDDFRAGIENAIGCYNKLFAAIEREVSKELMHMIEDGASRAARLDAYHDAASRLRYVGAKGLYQEISAKLPPRHIKEMLGY